MTHHSTTIVKCPFDKRRVLCSCGYQSERYDSTADATEDESRHLSLDAPEDYESKDDFEALLISLAEECGR